MCVHIYIYISKCTRNIYIYMCVCVLCLSYICVCACVFVYKYIYIYTHVNTNGSYGILVSMRMDKTEFFRTPTTCTAMGPIKLVPFGVNNTIDPVLGVMSTGWNEWLLIWGFPPDTGWQIKSRLISKSAPCNYIYIYLFIYLFVCLFIYIYIYKP